MRKTNVCIGGGTLLTKKGFTLIELLAVIVILAIIALIATPIVLSIIDDSKESSMIRSAEGYIRAVEYEVAQAYVTANRITEGTYYVLPGGDICIDGYENNTCTGNILEIEYNNEGPISGSITFVDTKIKTYTLTYPSGITVVDGRVGEENIPTLSETILKQAKDNNYYYTTTPDFSKVTTDGEYGLYQASDDLGTSYYFRGDTENNYVVFGTEYNKIKKWCIVDDTVGDDGKYKCIESYGLFDDHDTCSPVARDLDENMIVGGAGCEETYVYGNEMYPVYWRIIRINGDGTIRMIYDGTEKMKNGTTRSAIIDNTIYGDNLDYGSSIIKETINDWYVSNLKTNYGKYIADEIFCNDMELIHEKYYTDESWNEVSATPTEYYEYYYAPIRLNNYNNAPSPQLTCTRKLDRYTINTELGNGLLSNPIGLITADEISMAGGLDGTSNKIYYLYTGSPYWTLSPAYDTTIDGTIVWTSGYNASLERIDIAPGEMMLDVRPVINLKADVEFTGDGSFDNPYVIVTE